jgi:hypothetical protein
MARRPDHSSHSRRLHDERETARREAKAAKVRPASPTIYCTSPESHAAFHRLLRGHEPVCCICGPKAADE